MECGLKTFYGFAGFGVPTFADTYFNGMDSDLGGCSFEAKTQQQPLMRPGPPNEKSANFFSLCRKSVSNAKPNDVSQ